MATDEAVFRETIRTSGVPTLRFYGWKSPALSLGHFQELAGEVDLAACRRLGIGVVRRPTGGRAVLHDRELTYAVIARQETPPFTPDILETFRIVSGCVAAGLAALGVTALLKGPEAEATDAPRHAACFSSPSRHELVAGGRKICGAAQIRSQGAFLQHGSLLTAFDPRTTCALLMPHGDPEVQERRLREAVTTVGEQAGREVDAETLALALREGFERTLGVRCTEAGLTAAEAALRDELMAGKYGCDRWNQEGRSGEWISAL